MDRRGEPLLGQMAQTVSGKALAEVAEATRTPVVPQQLPPVPSSRPIGPRELPFSRRIEGRDRAGGRFKLGGKQAAW
jgi:hypothetical protein